MSESKKTVSTPETPENVLSPFSKDWSDRLTRAQYDGFTRASQTVEPFAPTASPLTVKDGECIVDSDTRKKYREKVLAAPMEKVKLGVYSLNKAVTEICWKTMNRAYATKSPWVVTETLAGLKGVIDRGLFTKVKQYFKLAGFELSDSGVIMCLGIIDCHAHAAVQKRLEKIMVNFIHLEAKKETAIDLTESDPAKRIRDSLTRVHDSAKRKAGVDKTSDGQAFYAREMALATAARDVLALLVEGSDPIRTVEQFKAWLENPHAEEIEQKA